MSKAKNSQNDGDEKMKTKSKQNTLTIIEQTVSIQLIFTLEFFTKTITYFLFLSLVSCVLKNSTKKKHQIEREENKVWKRKNKKSLKETNMAERSGKAEMT